MSLIDIQHLRKAYQDHVIFSSLDFQVEEGSFISIVGKSGVGKSTLINMIGLLDPFYEGQYLIKGTEVSGASNKDRTQLRNKMFGFVFQMYNLINCYTVKDNIILPVLYSQKKTVDEKHYRSLLKMLRIEHLEGQYAMNLSGGEKQRVAIARAAINKPAVLIADEPTGNLDVENTNNVLEIFRYLQSEQGVTIIMVTHDPYAAKTADQVYNLLDGKLVVET